MLFLAVLVQALVVPIEGHTEVIYLNITETHDSFNNSFLNGVFLMLAFLSGIIIFLILFDILHMLQIQLVPRSPLERFKKKRKTTRIEVASKTIP